MLDAILARRLLQKRGKAAFFMSEPLGHRVAAYFRAGMSPDPERRHKEVMRAIQATDYKEWEHYKRAQEEASEFWASEMARLEREIEEANKDYTPEGDFPECSANLARENLEKGRWRLQRPPAVVYTVLGICCNSVAAVLVDAIYSNTRRQKYFDESMPYFASKWGVAETSVWNALKLLKDKGVLIRVARPGKSSLLALNLDEIYRRVNIYEHDGGEALMLDEEERKRELKVKRLRQPDE